MDAHPKKILKTMMESWYCIRSKPNKEEFLCGQLTAREIEVFYPRLRVEPVNPRASKIRPYFPGYMFVYLNLDEIGTNALQWMPGALGLVFYGNEPVLVQEELINAIRNRVEAVNASREAWPSGLKPGDTVRVIAGPFTGYEGIFDLRLAGSERARIFLFLLEQQMKVDLPATYIQLKGQA
jgi:transcription antitermination factor NusG